MYRADEVSVHRACCERATNNAGQFASRQSVNTSFLGCVTRSLLTRICLVDFSILIKWASPFPISGVSGLLLHLYLIFNRNSCKQTVKTLIRRRILRRLIWVCTVWLGPKIGTPGLYGLKATVTCFCAFVLSTCIFFKQQYHYNSGQHRPRICQS